MPLGLNGIVFREKEVDEVASGVLLTLDTPLGVEENDLLLAFIVADSVAAFSVVPSGWTLITSVANSTFVTLYAYWRAATDSEPANHSWEFAGATTWQGVMLAYKNVDVSDPIDVSGSASGTGASSPTSIVAPSVTTTVDQAMVVHGFGTQAAVTAWTLPGGETERYSDISDPALAAADVKKTTAGATGTSTATVTAGAGRRWVAISLALTPYVAAASTLQLIGAAETVTLLDAAGDYHLLWGQWSPQVARLRGGVMGNLPPYSDVEEQMALNVEGSAPATTLANLAALAGLLDEAELHKRNDSEDAVAVAYQPAGATERVVARAVIWGGVLEPPTDFDALGMTARLREMALAFARRGQWLGATDTRQAAAAEQPAKLTVAFMEDAEAACPYTLTLGNSSGATLYDGFLFLARAAADIDIIEGEDGSGTGWSSEVDADEASGGNVGRWTPGGAGTWVQISFTMGAAIEHHLVGVYATIRDNLAGARTLTMYAETEAYGVANGQSRQVVLDLDLDPPTPARPRPFFIGMVHSAAARHDALNLWLQVDSLTASPTFDFDTIVLIGLDNDDNRVVTILGGQDAYWQDIESLTIDPRQGTLRAPVVTAVDGSAQTHYIPAAGDRFLAVKGQGLTAALMMCNTSAGHWRWTDGLGAMVENSLTVVRQNGYVTPR